MMHRLRAFFEETWAAFTWDVKRSWLNVAWHATKPLRRRPFIRKGKK